MNRPAADTRVRRALLDSEKPEKRGSNLACLKCRAIKVKCSRANADDERCKRCNRLDLVCEFKEHHRGRKPKKRPRSDADSFGVDEEDQLEDDDAEHVSFSANSNTSPVRAKPRELSRSPPPPSPPPQYAQHPQHPQHAHRGIEITRTDRIEPAPKLPSPKGSVHGRWFGPYLQSIPSFEDSLFARKPHQATQLHDQDRAQQDAYAFQHDRSRELPPLAGPSSATANRTAPPPPLRAKDQTAWDRTSAWSSAQNAMQRSHPGASTAAAAPPPIAAELGDDAVRQHIISIDQAHELFEFYFAELNPPLALLDASLHTPDYCRQNAPILFSTIVAVASRFFQPHLHRQCHRVAKAVLNLAAAQEVCSIDHVQALVLVITWKDPGDQTIVRKAARAMGYAYELGLHATFEAIEADDATSRARAEGGRNRSDSFSQRYRRRLERDGQRTWIVLCLVHELVRRDDRHAKPRARIIPLEDYPDPYAWIRAGGDVLLSVDSRLAWSLDMSILTLENEAFLDMISRSKDATSFGGFFDRYRARLDMLRRRYFEVSDGVYHPRFPMDKSAVAELPYLDGFRDFYICQSTWHWAAKVAAGRNKARGDMAEHRSAFWFAQTVDSAMRCLRLFAHNLCKPGYVRVGHDYLVITASEVVKWFYLYRSHLDAATVVEGVGFLREMLRECKQPQRLKSGEVVDTEREAPGYLVRFIAAIFDAGLEKSCEQAKQSVAASKEAYAARPHHWDEARTASWTHERGAADAYRDARFAMQRPRPEMGRAATFAEAYAQDSAPHPAYLSPAPATATAAGTSMPMPTGWNNTPAVMGHPQQLQQEAKNTVLPLAAEIGRNSIDGLAACLNARDLTYWQDILGFDLATPAV